jgi:hypothetical protein
MLLGLCSASAVFSFLPVLRRGLINLEGYTAFSLFPHLSAIPLQRRHEALIVLTVPINQVHPAAQDQAEVEFVLTLAANYFAGFEGAQPDTRLVLVRFEKRVTLVVIEVLENFQPAQPLP